MSSRRKSSIPKHNGQSECSADRKGGARARSDDSDDDIDDIIKTENFQEGGVMGGASAVEGVTTVVEGVVSAAEGGYECKYCGFQTSDLKLFTAHVDSEHPTIVTNTSYVCLECDYNTRSYDTLQVHNSRCHPGEDSFTRTMVTRNNQTIFQQSVNDLTFDGSFVKSEVQSPSHYPTPITLSPAHGALSPAPLTLSPAHGAPVRRRSRGEASRPSSPPPADVIKVESEEEEDYDSKEMPVLSPAPGTPLTPVTTAAPVAPELVSANQSFMVNGSSVQLKGGGVLASGTLAQVLTALQGQVQSNSPQTQLLIPVSSIPTYSPSMDHNLLLISAFNRFPYPAVAEILSLSSQTKFSEEQIKVWFSAQRLKHGVSWTPEEVDEARRKKSNAALQAPATITVMNLSSNGLQSLFGSCQGLVLTQLPPNGHTLPLALTVTPSSTSQAAAHSPASDPSHTQTQTETAPGLDLSPTTSSHKPKKSKEQLAELKASYSRRPFASETEISRLMQVTRLSKRAIKKWFSDTRYNQRNSREHHGLGPPDPLRAGFRSRTRPEPESARGLRASILIDSSDETDSTARPRSPAQMARPRFPAQTQTARSRSPAQTARSRCPAQTQSARSRSPAQAAHFTPQRFKEKTEEQRLELEKSFKKSADPSDEELNRLKTTTKLTLRELETWFNDRRRLPQGRNDEQGSFQAGASSQATAPSAGGGRRAVKKSPEQLRALKRAFVASQWPTSAEYERLSADTRLPRSDIINWFGDARYAVKNSSLRWYYLYQTGQGDEALNGGGSKKKKGRKRFKGWSRRRRRATPTETSVVKVKPGVWFLKDYFSRHRSLNESDLDELVSKSGLSYERVRDWFQQEQNQVQTREEQELHPEEAGLEPGEGPEEEREEGPEEEREEGPEEGQEEDCGAEQEMDLKEQEETEGLKGFALLEKDNGNMGNKGQSLQTAQGISQSQPEETANGQSHPASEQQT